jgi:methyl-accepting chemotaxis protein PixJ
LKFFDVRASPTLRLMQRLLAVPESFDQTEPALLNQTQGDPLADRLPTGFGGDAQQNDPAQISDVQLSQASFLPTHTTKVEHIPMQDLKFRPEHDSTIPSEIDADGLVARNDTSDLQWLLAATTQMHQAETVETLFNATVAEVRQHFQADRVLLYCFQGAERGLVVAESMAEGYTPTQGQELPAIAFGAENSLDYQQRSYVVLTNASPTDLSPYQAQLLEQFQIKSSVSLPILIERQVWGLLVVQQCSAPRHWTNTDITQLYQMVMELRLNLQPVEARERLHRQSKLEKSLARLAADLSQSTDVAALVQMAARSARHLLKCDRATIYRFNQDGSGEYVAEAKAEEALSLLDQPMGPQLIDETTLEQYQRHAASVVNEMTEGTPETTESLEALEIRAYLSVPIFREGQLWGLLTTYQTAAYAWQPFEISLLQQLSLCCGMALKQIETAAKLQTMTGKIAQITEQESLVTKVIERIRRSPDLQTIFTTTAQEIRHFLKSDRVAIFKFNAGYSDGQMIAESVQAGYTSALEKPVTDHCFSESMAERYRQGRIGAIANIYEEGIADCYIEVLAQFEVQANLVVPLLKGDELWGLFCIHQCDAPREWLEPEIELAKQISAHLNIAIQQSEYLEQLQQRSEQLARTAEQERLIAGITGRIRQSLDLQNAFKVTTREVRNFLQTDRAAIYQFEPDSGYSAGQTISESVAPGYLSALDVQITDHCFQENFAEEYRAGRTWMIHDIHQAGLPECLEAILSKFQAQASLVVPLLKGDELWGLFYTHQCSGPREWAQADLEFAKQIAAQLNIAIKQGEYLAQLQKQSEQLAAAAERERTAKEQLQQQVIQVLTAVRPALEGDLTVRAPVTDNEIGTIADVYNNTLNSLKQLVTQMQAASQQVTQTSETSATAIAELSAKAQAQFQALNQTLEQVQALANSIEAVERNAQEVETAVQQANQIVLVGDHAIDRSVDEMQEIRETVAETNRRLKRLGESSQKISKVVSLISNFTTQTQLLSLNASIEATRAGEYGRGFAVVADEVRSLARQSAEAATEIEQLVQEIQGNTAEVSTAMERGIQQVASGTQVVNETRQSLNNIVNATSQISQLVMGITQATQAQTQQYQAVAQTVTEVAAIANTTSASSTAIVASFEDLLVMAQTLQERSTQFKVD